jgi:hypothetical protein
MEKFYEEMFKVWKSSWESYGKTLSALQAQGEKMLELALSQGSLLQEEAQKRIKEGMANLKEAQKAYLRTVDENLKKMEDLFKKK